MTAREAYQAGQAARGREVDQLEARSRIIGLGRLGVALAAIALVGGIAWAHLPATTWGAVALLVAAFVSLVIVHARVIGRRGRAAAARRFHERGLARLDGAWHELPATGEAFATPDHPYAADLDLFGRASLFQRIDATETRFGAATLASWLRGGVGEFPRDVRARQEAVRELAPLLELRERLSAAGAALGGDGGATTKPDPAPFLAWAKGGSPLEAAAWLRVAARVLPLLTVAALLLSRALPSFTWVGLVALQLVLTAPARARVAEIAAKVSSKERGLTAYGEMLELLESAPFTSPALRALQAELTRSGASATREMASLGRILGFLDARQNEVFRAFVGPLLLWDLNCVLGLEAWRARAGERAEAWLAALGEVEALGSLAGLAFDNPSFAWPELSDAPCFVARALGHPLLVEGKRVANDVQLGARGHALIVTGSNMSGKSTLLRAMGVNTALALAGAPVCAEALTVGDLRLVTSMRVTDSLDGGVSHFYAELQKLKMVIDMARGSASTPRGVFFLLDEILHGTNTRERLIGARAIVRELVKVGALGAVSTHDLGIGDLAAELPEHVRNVHFEEQVEGEKMSFDYLLREGVVQSSNALRLMKIVGIDVL